MIAIVATDALARVRPGLVADGHFLMAAWAAPFLLVMGIGTLVHDSKAMPVTRVTPVTRLYLLGAVACGAVNVYRLGRDGGALIVGLLPALMCLLPASLLEKWRGTPRIREDDETHDGPMGPR